MDALQQYLAPYLTANAIALALVGVAFWRPRIARWACVLVFAWAAATNAFTALTNPVVYVEYGDLTPSTMYASFIRGWFSQHVQLVVLPVALGQLCIALLLGLNGRWRRLGVVGAAVFLLAIAPLGVGSAFPFSLTFIAALVLMDRGLLMRESVEVDLMRVHAHPRA